MILMTDTDAAYIVPQEDRSHIEDYYYFIHRIPDYYKG